MIEAINASISSAPIVRAIVAEASTSQSANPSRTQKSATTSPYESFHAVLSPEATPVFVVRDANSSTQLKQFPTDAQIRAYQKATAAKTATVDQASGETRTISPEQARIIIKSSVEFKQERAAVEADAQAAPPATFDEQA